MTSLQLVRCHSYVITSATCTVTPDFQCFPSRLHSINNLWYNAGEFLMRKQRHSQTRLHVQKQYKERVYMIVQTCLHAWWNTFACLAECVHMLMRTHVRYTLHLGGTVIPVILKFDSALPEQAPFVLIWCYAMKDSPKIHWGSLSLLLGDY